MLFFGVGKKFSHFIFSFCECVGREKNVLPDFPIFLFLFFESQHFHFKRLAQEAEEDEDEVREKKEKKLEAILLIKQTNE